MCEPPEGRDLRGAVTQLVGHLLNGDLRQLGVLQEWGTRGGR